MSEDECARAIAYGMMAVEPGIDALAVGEMGIANTTIAAALCLALFGGDAAEWTGPGTGVAGAALANKRAVVAAAVARHRPEAGDPLELLRRLGGLEFAAMAGAILAARMGRVPVVLDGFCSDRRRRGALRRRSAGARPLRRRPRLGRAGPSPSAANGSASGRCSISACGSAKPPARRWPWRC